MGRRWWVWGAGRLTSARRGTVLAVCVSTCAFAAGCGSSAPTPPPTVQISLTAPTDGATVGVQRVLVFGTVVPAWSTVRIAGVRVHVANGGFRRWIYLRRGLSRIRIIGTARGYLPDRMRVAVRSAVFHTVVITKTLPRWAAQAERVCDVANRRIEALPAGTTFDSLRYLSTFQAVAAWLDDRLTAIRPPRSRAAAYAAFVTQQRLVDAQANQMVTEFRNGRFDLNLLRAEQRAAVLANHRAARLGMTACAQDPVPHG